ncbi:unnamed protein product [Notodromas monacha]|uniref:Alpha-N-acetylglucosaminidase C-terminal domain-containing protein n=1 Tax=Notodromas monacha TaxID=399045 RepID=A0A7R9C3C3_9CRUS|nr:unnamed protein product [Notodromas monacha]CAG0925024.1 unnamed protein product [Notodromas monacha]
MRRYGLSMGSDIHDWHSVTGRSNSTWTSLIESVYTAHLSLPPHGHPVIAKRPHLNLEPFVWYNKSQIWSAWENLVLLGLELELQGNTLTPGLKEDIVDIGRQCLEVQFDELYVRLLERFKKKDVNKVLGLGGLLMDTLVDLDNLLGTHKSFLLGQWLQGAQRSAFDPKDEENLRFNAMNQITWWGPNAEILDYAFKQWSGVISDYVLPRWSAFIQYLVTSIVTQHKYSQAEFDALSAAVEEEFITSSKYYSAKAKGGLLMDTLVDLDNLLGTHKSFLLGQWLQGAQRSAFDPKDEENLRFNAMNQITWWGPNAEILDYAFKQWSGVISDYVLPRWSAFIQYLVTSIVTQHKYSQAEFDALSAAVEEEFITSSKYYSAKAKGDVLETAQKLFKKWSIINF